MSEGDASAQSTPRYSDQPLPPYSYVPGFSPHPVSDPRGHMHGVLHAPVAPLDPANWRASPAYLYAVDLFNHSYYWEAHEAWESLWHAAGRQGPVAVWLKALIKLAAAGVKAREGNARGVARHARRARELLAEVRASLPPNAARYCGVALNAIDEAAESLATEAGTNFSRPRPDLQLTQWIDLRDG